MNIICSFYNIFVRELYSKVLKEALLLLLAWKHEQIMFQMEQKCSLTEFAPSQTKNVPNGKKNVQDQNLLRIEQKMLQKEQKGFIA